MITARVTITGTSPYSQSRPIQTPKDAKETSDDHEQRTWRERIHADENGEVFIPPTALKNALSEAAKYLGKQIPGKGKSTYTKHFEAGVLSLDPIPLGIQRDAVPGERLFVPADGRRGGPKRVWKTFPTIPSGWKGTATFLILDPLVTREVFEEHIRETGNFIGIGRFRPRNNGYYGRFRAEIVEWKEAS